MAATTDPVIQTFFGVSIDGHDIGAWTGVRLGGVEVVTETYEEGGNNGYVHHLPGRLQYQNIVLTRTFNEDSAKVASWFASMGGSVTRATGVITAYRNDRTAFAVWNFTGAVPVKWQLPSFDVGQAGAAIETLELAHYGFVA